MNHNQLIELLTDYKSYKYALKNVGNLDTGLPLIFADRIRNPSAWDATRYSRIVGMIEGAIDEVLSDDHRMVIMRKYLDRNTLTLNEIADHKHIHRTTISRWHREALRRLSVALAPLTSDEKEINNIDHMFDPMWKFQESA